MSGLLPPFVALIGDDNEAFLCSIYSIHMECDDFRLNEVAEYSEAWINQFGAIVDIQEVNFSISKVNGKVVK